MKSVVSSRFGRAYIAAVFLFGVAIMVHAVAEVGTGQFGNGWMLFALLTFISASFSVKVPGVSATISVSETFVFTLIVLYGPAPAVVTVAIDGLLMALRRKNLEIERVLFNFAEPSVTAWTAAMAFYFVAPGPIGATKLHLSALLLPAFVMCAAYFLMNSWLNAVAVTAETGIPAHRIWRKYFLWVSLNYLGSASIAVLLVSASSADIPFSSVGAIAPLLLISYLTFKTSMGRVEDANNHLAQLNRLYLSTVETLAMAIDAKDQVTHGHIRRVQIAAVGLARAAGVSDELEIKAIEAAALLHDMGKLAVPEHILNKPGKLTESEYEKMKRHAPVGAEILSAVDFPYPVVPIVRHHHENWDGTGYPDGIKGADIPIGARILAIVDCYDALTSDRPYRRAISGEDALAIVTERRGTMYDPNLVDTFCRASADIVPGNEPEVGTSALAHVARSTQERHDIAPVRSDAALKNCGEEVLRLCDLTERLAHAADLEEIGGLVSRQLRRVAPIPLVVFYVTDTASDELVASYASGYGDMFVEGMRLPIGTGISGWVAAHRMTIVNSDPALDFGQRLDAQRYRLAGALSTPLVSGSTLVGVLALYATERDAFTQEQRQVFEVMAREIAPAIERALHVSATRPVSLRDDATGLFSDRYLTHLSASVSFNNAPMMESLGVLCLTAASRDADDAREAFVRLTAAAMQSVRIADMVFRRSDQEIVVLMPSSDVSAGEMVIERIAGGLREDGGGGRMLSLAVGFACAPLDGKRLSQLLDMAERRRYMLGVGQAVQVRRLSASA